MKRHLPCILPAIFSAWILVSVALLTFAGSYLPVFATNLLSLAFVPFLPFLPLLRAIGLSSGDIYPSPRPWGFIAVALAYNLALYAVGKAISRSGRAKRGLLSTAAVLAVVSLARAERAPANAASAIQGFVAAHYAELKTDLQKGGGATLTSLLAMLRTPADEKDGTTHRLCALSDAYPVPSEFAARVPDFAHQDVAPAAPAAAAKTSDLETLFHGMPYKTLLHVSFANGNEIDGRFSSFDPFEKAVWIKVIDPAGGSERKRYALQAIKRVSVLDANVPDTAEGNPTRP